MDYFQNLIKVALIETKHASIHLEKNKKYSTILEKYTATADGDAYALQVYGELVKHLNGQKANEQIVHKALLACTGTQYEHYFQNYEILNALKILGPWASKYKKSFLTKTNIENKYL